MENEISRLFGKIKIEEPHISVEESSSTEGQVVIEPLLRGYGTTVGNALRRVMLSSLPGAAVTSIKVSSNGVTALHEITSLPGVREDVCEIVMNVKGIIAKLYSDVPVTAYIDVTRDGEVTAGDISANSEIEIVNPSKRIATLVGDTDFHMELTFGNGTGYLSADRNKEKYGVGEIGRIYVDSIYTPVLNANYTVENTRVGSLMDYDKLTLTVTTNDSIRPKEAVVIASQILKEHFGLLAGLCGETCETKMMEKSKTEQRKEALDRSIDEMEFTVRSYNCLKRAGIDTIADLTERTSEEMMKIRNLGRKSYEEIEDKLHALGLKFREEES